MGNVDYSILGKRFGKLTVLEFDHVDPINGAYWLCECDCGNRKIIKAGNLRNGGTTSCGCSRREKKPRNRYPVDLTGMKFGRLHVVNFDHRETTGNSYYLCLCDCGTETIVDKQSLVHGNTTSCGCARLDASTKHGMSGSSLYGVWRSMKKRCNNTKHMHYDRYGGRGIAVCDEWLDFENFRDWALNNGYDPELTLDRIDNDDGYYPGNCRWVDYITQNNNQSSNRRITYNGITHTIAEWARIFDLKYYILQRRVKRGDMRDFEYYFNNERFNEE